MDDDPRSDHLRPTLFQRPDRLADPLYVVTTVFNATRWRSRWKLYEDFAKMVAEAGAILYTVEVAFGERAFAVTSPTNPRHVQLRTKDELWLKENAINVGVGRLPATWKYVAWVDADVVFARGDWANETLHQLQHYAVVQMWSQFQDLTSDHELVGTAHGFMANYLNGVQAPKDWRPGYPYGYAAGGYPGAPGLAWACTRTAWNTFGGLLDICILGACDWYMAWGLIGQLERVLNPKYTTGYLNRLRRWQRNAAPLQHNIGVVPGLALHYWHGAKAGRKYQTRDQVLIRRAFDPDHDLWFDWQGLYQLRVEDARTRGLRDDLRTYFRERDEDTPTPRK
jgi:hypothetical protein